MSSPDSHLPLDNSSGNLVACAEGVVREEWSVAEILANAKPGDAADRGDNQQPAHAEKLFPLVYAELRALAAHYLKSRPGHTLQPTALVHEAYLKLVGDDRPWSGKDHFAATAARAMRQVLVDHARRKGAVKRGGGESPVDFGETDISFSLAEVDAPDIASQVESKDERNMRILELDTLLTELAASDRRASQVAEMRLFGGMNQDQIALVLGVSRKTITLDWRFARAWLAARASADSSDATGGRAS